LSKGPCKYNEIEIKFEEEIDNEKGINEKIC